MDSLKTLMDKKSYDLVIKLTENSHDPIALFYRVSALIAVGQSEKALDTIVLNRLILKEKLSLLIKFHIEILCYLKRFDEAYQELTYYQELPYESQEVEEILKEMPAYIRKEEKNSYAIKHEPSEEEMKKRLTSSKDEEVLAALDEIKNVSIAPYLIYLLKIMSSHPRQVIRAFALLLLVNQKYDKEVDYLYEGKLIKIVPSSLEEPFLIPGFGTIDNFSFALQNEYHDPSIVQNALHLISSYLLYIYPRQIAFSSKELIVIFGYLAKKLLMNDISDLKEVCLNKGLDYQLIITAIEEIDSSLKSF